MELWQPYKAGLDKHTVHIHTNKTLNSHTEHSVATTCAHTHTNTVHISQIRHKNKTLTVWQCTAYVISQFLPAALSEAQPVGI